MDDGDTGEYVKLPITDELDLHSFSPRDLKTLVPDYLRECRKLGILEGRLIHGKGIGNLRRSVHALLERDPAVREYRLADADCGGWGATIVSLRPLMEVE